MTGARGEHPALSLAVEDREARREAAQRAWKRWLREQRREPRWRRRSVRSSGRRSRPASTTPAPREQPSWGPTSSQPSTRRSSSHRAALAAAEKVLAEPEARRLLDAPAPDLGALEAAHRAATDVLEAARAAHQLALRRQSRVTAPRRRAPPGPGRLDAGARAARARHLACRRSPRARSPDNRLQMRLSAYVLAYRLAAGGGRGQRTARRDERPALLPRARRPARGR